MNGRTKRLGERLEDVERIAGGDGICQHGFATRPRPSIAAFAADADDEPEDDLPLICARCGLLKLYRPRIVPAGPDWKAPEDRRVGGDDD
jgi:hypothetical protein